MTVNWKNIKNDIVEMSPVVVAISGGVDSMVLLDTVRRTLNPSSYIVAHFNHHIRDTNEEEYMVEAYCNKYNLTYSIGHGKNLKDMSNQENEARIQRWSFLETVASNNQIKHIMTAHHKNDLIENFIIQIMRGNDIRSCPMIKKTLKNGFVRYKPFLDVFKNDLIVSAKKHNIKWIEDETNNDTDYTRNLVRHVILPAMMQDRNVMNSIPKTIQSVLNM